MKRLLMIAASVVALGGCYRANQTGDVAASQQQEQLAARAQDEVGIYQPTHFTRKRLANRIGQMLDDPTLATISYSQSLDGRLHCIGHTIGFPMPGATQTTSPQKWQQPPYVNSTYSDWTLAPQAEPDQLFSPSTEDATWLLLVNDKTGQSAPAYFEGHVETFLASNKPDASLIAQDCTG